MGVWDNVTWDTEYDMSMSKQILTLTPVCNDQAAEHLELCPLARVPCLNKEYGCDAELLRRDLATHLPSCPANIITCTQEWNR